MLRSSSKKRRGSSGVPDTGGSGGAGGRDDEGGGGGGDGGRPVKVAYAGNQAEAEMIQGLLSEHGIPSMLQRTRGFDVPQFLAAGPRDVLVPEAVAERAREVLEGTPGSG